MEHRSRLSFENTLGGWRRPSAPLFTKVPRKANSPRFASIEFLEVGRLPQHRYGAYDPSPVVSSSTCLASSTNEPGARWISDGMPASFSTPSISSATDSSGAAATFTHLSAMHASYSRLVTEARRRGVTTVTVVTMKYKGWLIDVSDITVLPY